MRPLEIRTSNADFAILNNTINIDKFPKIHAGNNKHELIEITDDNQRNIMCYMK